MIAREELGDVPADKKKMKVSTFSLTRHAKIFGPLVSHMADMRHVIYWAELYLEIWFNQTTPNNQTLVVRGSLVLLSQRSLLA